MNSFNCTFHHCNHTSRQGSLLSYHYCLYHYHIAVTLMLLQYFVTYDVERQHLFDSKLREIKIRKG